nr:hypothetical protein CFP56_04880 [Quercus suber]
MAPDTLKILLLRWKLSLGVMGFGRDDDIHNNDPSICLLYAVVLPCVAAVFQVRVSFVNDVQKQEAWWERQHELAAENFGVFQVRVSFVNDVQKQEAWWERQHELAAENFGVLLKELTGIAINFM